MLFGALDLMALRGEKPPDDLLLVVVPDEEVSGHISEMAVRRWSEGARALLVIEPERPAATPRRWLPAGAASPSGGSK